MCLQQAVLKYARNLESRDPWLATRWTDHAHKALRYPAVPGAAGDASVLGSLFERH